MTISIYLALTSAVLLSMSLRSDGASADQWLMKRSSRPMMAEGVIQALRPWETPVEGFFVRSHHNTMPTRIDDSWMIAFEGLIKRPQKRSLKSLKSRRNVSFHAVLECSGNGRGLFDPPVSGIQWGRGAVGNAEWTGISVKALMTSLGVQANAQYATFEGYDEPVLPSKAKFVRSIPVALLQQTDAILAFSMNRAPLPVAHGGPVRLVMPGIYGQNWVKWVNKITFSSEPDRRNYAAKAYRMPTKPIRPGESWDPVKDGRPIDYIKVQTIFTHPQSGDALAPGSYELRGKTFSGSGAITKVEISLDGGKSWAPARLSQRKDFSWQEFTHAVDVKDSVAYEAMARATDALGQTQPLSQEWNPKGYLYNAVDRVQFRGDAAAAERGDRMQLVQQNCLTCHSSEIIEQQTLSKEGWVGVIKKMADYGLHVDQETTEKMASVLADSSRNPSSRNPGSLWPRADHGLFGAVDLAQDTDLLISPLTASGLAASGRVVFQAHCAACHGREGEGQSAPRLKGRLIPKALFFATLKQGRRTMPAFEGRLSLQEMENMRAWLQ